MESRAGRLYVTNDKLEYVAEIELAVADDLLDWLSFATSSSYPRRENGCLTGPAETQSGLLACPLSGDGNGWGPFTLITGQPGLLAAALLGAAANSSAGINISADHGLEIETGDPRVNIKLMNGKEHKKMLIYRAAGFGTRDIHLARAMSCCDLVELAMAIYLAVIGEPGNSQKGKG